MNSKSDNFYIMDSSVILFVTVVGIGFVFLKWMVSPIPHEIPHELNQHISSNGSNNSRSNRRTRRPVTDSMIEVVHAIAPQLTVGQIRMDLERSGSVELTIERYMETGSLPFPLGEQPASFPEETLHHNVSIKKEPVSLIEKYHLESKLDDGNGVSTDVDETIVSSGKNNEEKRSLLEKRREEMILRARKRLESQLKNEIPL